MLDIDSDVLEIARRIAQEQNLPLGKVISHLCRRSFSQSKGEDDLAALFNPLIRGQAITDQLLKTIHRECDPALAECEFTPYSDWAGHPFAASVCYRRLRIPRYEIKVIGEADFASRSVVYGVTIIDTEVSASTPLNAILKYALEDENELPNYGAATIRILHDIYGPKLFLEEVLSNPRVPWFTFPTGEQIGPERK